MSRGLFDGLMWLLGGHVDGGCGFHDDSHRLSLFCRSLRHYWIISAINMTISLEGLCIYQGESLNYNRYIWCGGNGHFVGLVNILLGNIGHKCDNIAGGVMCLSGEIVELQEILMVWS